MRAALVGRPVGEMSPVVIVRCDKETEFEKVYAVMKARRHAGGLVIRVRHIEKPGK